MMVLAHVNLIRTDAAATVEILYDLDGTCWNHTGY